MPKAYKILGQGQFTGEAYLVAQPGGAKQLVVSSVVIVNPNTAALPLYLYAVRAGTQYGMVYGQSVAPLETVVVRGPFTLTANDGILMSAGGGANSLTATAFGVEIT